MFLRKGKDEFGFNSGFPDPPPGAENWEPDPAGVPKPGTIKDLRFNRSPGADARGAFRRPEPKPQQVLGSTNNPIFNGLRTPSGSSQHSVQLTSGWPTPEQRVSGPPRESLRGPVSRPFHQAREVPTEAKVKVTSSASSISEQYDVKPPSNAPTSGTTKPSAPSVPPHLRARATRSARKDPSAPSTASGSSLTQVDKGTSITSRPAPGVHFSISEGKTASTVVGSSDDAWGEIGRQISDFTSDTLVDNSSLDDAGLAEREQMREFGTQNEEEGRHLQAEILRQIAKTAESSTSKSHKNYEKYLKVQDLLWKAQDLLWMQGGLDAGPAISREGLTAMAPKEIEDYHADICQLHQHWWEHRYEKASELQTMQVELGVEGQGMYSVEEMLAMEVEDLGRLERKIRSAHKQHKGPTHGGTPLARPENQQGVFSAKDGLDQKLNANMSMHDFYPSDDSSNLASFETVSALSSDDKRSDHENDDERLIVSPHLNGARRT